ncbi:MAG: LPS-assembly protein LptD [Rhodocyclaceae bacterium]|nr:LPS-assembly protein LptD [Rhodocyclaceae bacterium]
MRRSPLLCCLWLLAGPALAAETGSEAALPTEVEADRVRGRTETELVAEGDARLQQGDVQLRADRLVYRGPLDQVEAEGEVELRRGEDFIAGPALLFNLTPRTGSFETPTYYLSRPPSDSRDGRRISGGGGADKLRFEGPNRYRLFGATWSTCEAPEPDWYLRAGELELDYNRQLGEAWHGTLVFKDVPLFYLPWVRFPLVGQRQSGLLAPTIGQSNKTGFDLTQPYYWNIAPNFDATLIPRFMSRRGLQLGGEFRYLQPSFAGELRAEYLHNDDVRGGSRAAGSVRHRQRFSPDLAGSLELNRVSDVEYFEDLSSRLSVTSQSNLLNRLHLGYQRASWWRADALLQGYQTIEGAEPYRMLPRLGVHAWRDSVLGEFDLKAEFTRFEHPDSDRAQGSRSILYPTLAYPLRRSAYSITPKFGLHLTHYDLDQPVSAGARTSLTRSVPIASIDGQLNFEREFVWRGRRLIQTLEPRLYYLYVPFHDQDPAEYPVFDSAAYDFNFTQIFQPNLYSGSDRIANADQLTAAVTSRILDEDGVELMRAAIGQRYYFDEQRVRLTASEPLRTGRRADVLASFSGRLPRHLRVSSDWQYNPRDHWTERFNLSLRYQPAHAQVLNAGFRYTRDVLRDLDLSAQWPLGRRWYGVARYTRSLREHRVTEAIGGLEYNGGCWVFRIAMHRFATNPEDATQAVFVQLELGGLASVGSSPVNLLRRSVRGYGNINDRPDDPVFGYGGVP